MIHVCTKGRINENSVEASKKYDVYVMYVLTDSPPWLVVVVVV